ncbi:MAG: threonine synthase [Candidatus Rokuibacteriota bacterium]|nr:MAG: threonine synthase [Candidatus Rokubacteria bacterium]
MRFVTHIECTRCGHAHDPTRVATVCGTCGQMLAVRYDLGQVAAHVRRDQLSARVPGMYRFRELLPLLPDEEPVTLGEGGTPLLPLPRLAAHFGLRHLWAKDEGQNPTGTFKARGLSMAITRARSLGTRGVMIPSAGNAGGAAAVYAARAGLRAAVVVPRETPAAAVAEALIAGARVFTIEGSIATAGQVVSGSAAALGWFDLSTLKEPYRLEGKKTIGLELAEQLEWTTPDLLIYPTGGGTGLLGIAKAYEELRAMGWLQRPLPRFVAVQAEGCAPVVRAWLEKAATTTPWEHPVTSAAGLRVPAPFAGRQILEVLRATSGGAIAVSEAAIADAQRLLARLEGVWVAPEAAAAVSALGVLKDRRDLSSDLRIVLIVTGTGIKYVPPALPSPLALPRSDDAAVATICRALRE